MDWCHLGQTLSRRLAQTVQCATVSLGQCLVTFRALSLQREGLRDPENGGNKTHRNVGGYLSYVTASFHVLFPIPCFVYPISCFVYPISCFVYPISCFGSNSVFCLSNFMFHLFNFMLCLLNFMFCLLNFMICLPNFMFCFQFRILFIQFHALFT